MLYSGLVSITFRQLSTNDIIALCFQAGIDAIEWGGDIHVPHGDFARARQVRRITEEANLKIASYGSYYWAGHNDELEFEKVLQTAIELNAPVIRVWAGKKSPRDVEESYYNKVVDDSRRISDLAQNKGVKITFEFHRKTLTETNHSAKTFIETVSHNNVRINWQRPVGADESYCIEGLKSILPWLSNVHVFYWGSDPNEPLFLQEGAESWINYINLIRSTNRDHYLMIEFVKDNKPENFLRDAKTLSNWLKQLKYH